MKQEMIVVKKQMNLKIMDFKLYLISKDAARLVDPNKFETVKNEKESKKNRQIKKNSKK